MAFDLPASVSSFVAAADPHGSAAFISVAGFLTPSSMWLADAGADDGLQSEVGGAEVRRVARRGRSSSRRPRPTGRRSRTSSFIRRTCSSTATIRRFSTPTADSRAVETPNYSATIGKLWLEQGGVYVLANIRGGGEFGPAWHEAGLKTQRQIIYDDFAAVAQDLIARKITGPRRLGIMGGSNGGLLMGVEFTQHPELWNAVDIQVPLLDMLRFEQIAGRRVWVGEYGSVDDPDGARVPRRDLAVSQPAQGVSIRSLDLDDDEGRPRRSAARAQVRREHGGLGFRSLLTKYRGWARCRRQSEGESAHGGARVHVLRAQVDRGATAIVRKQRCRIASGPLCRY